MKRYWQLFFALFSLTFLIVVDQKPSFAMEQFINNAWNYPQMDSVFLVLCFALFLYFCLWASKIDILINHHILSTIILAVFLLFTCLSGSAVFKSNKDYWTLIFPVAFGILGGYYSSLQSIKTAKIEKALEYISKWDSSELQSHRNNLLSVKIPKPKTSDSNNIDNPNNNISLAKYLDNQVKENQTQIKTNQDPNSKKDEILGTAIKEIIQENNNIDLSLRVMSNFWEKIYVLLHHNLIYKDILYEVFYCMYKAKYAQSCQAYLSYLSSSDYLSSSENQEMINSMKNNLRELENKNKWGKWF